MAGNLSVFVALLVISFSAPIFTAEDSPQPATEASTKDKFITKLERARGKVTDPTADVSHQSAGVRYLAVLSLNAETSTDHEKALARALGDGVPQVRYSAAVRLAGSKRFAGKVAPLLVEALGHVDSTTFHLWGFRHTRPALVKLRSSAIPALMSAIDHPNLQLRKNGCIVLGDLCYIDRDRRHFQVLLKKLQKAIISNNYPVSRPMYVSLKMKIDGDAASAMKLLSADAESVDANVRIAALRECRYFSGGPPEWMIPVIVKALHAEEPRVARAAIHVLSALKAREEDLDVSAAMPRIIQLGEHADTTVRAAAQRTIDAIGGKSSEKVDQDCR